MFCDDCYRKVKVCRFCGEVIPLVSPCPKCGKPHQPKRAALSESVKPYLVGVGCVAAVIFYFSIPLLLPKSEPTPTTLEHKLAVVNAGEYVPEDDPTVDRAREYLKVIDERAVQNKQEIADIAVATWNELKSEGVQVSLLDVMIAIDESVPDEYASYDYAKMAALALPFLKSPPLE